MSREEGAVNMWYVTSGVPVAFSGLWHNSCVALHLWLQNGYDHDADVVYGDTDSVMVKFGCKTVAEAMPLAEKAAEEVSKIFPRPIKLEFEKVWLAFVVNTMSTC